MTYITERTNFDTTCGELILDGPKKADSAIVKFPGSPPFPLLAGAAFVIAPDFMPVTGLTAVII